MQLDSQSRKWQLTINNPIDKGFTHENIIEILTTKFKSIIYFCMSDEVGKNEGTPHTHVYVVFSSGVRFSTLLKHFEGAHFEMCKGNSQQNRDYVFKEGKYKGTEKEETRIEGTQFEWGEMPVERQGCRNDLSDVLDMIQSGFSDYDIILQQPDMMLNLSNIAQTRQIIQTEKFKNTFRKLEVVYIWGSTGTGKTRHVMEKYGYENVYRITNYKNPFDAYKNQDVILFDEFRSNSCRIPLGDMLKYLDGYPCDLPSRYADKHACFTKVYFTTNIPLDKQYEDIQREEMESYRAFLRRIHKIIHWDGEVNKQLNMEDYLNNEFEKYSGTLPLFKGGK